MDGQKLLCRGAAATSRRIACAPTGAVEERGHATATAGSITRIVSANSAGGATDIAARAGARRAAAGANRAGGVGGNQPGAFTGG